MKDPKDTETGVANAAGVVPGQRLLEIDIALPDPRQLKLIRRVGRWEGGKVGRWEGWEGKKITEWWVEPTIYRMERFLGFKQLCLSISCCEDGDCRLGGHKVEVGIGQGRRHGGYSKVLLRLGLHRSSSSPR